MHGRRQAGLASGVEEIERSVTYSVVELLAASDVDVTGSSDFLLSEMGSIARIAGGVGT